MPNGILNHRYWPNGVLKHVSMLDFSCNARMVLFKIAATHSTVSSTSDEVCTKRAVRSGRQPTRSHGH